MKKIIIGIAGNIGAGKGSTTEYIISQYGAEHMRYSHILQDILERLSLPYERKNLALLAEGLRSAFGRSILSQALCADVQKSDKDVIVFEGIRKKEELDYLRSMEGFLFIFVDAPIEVRYERLTQRNEKSDDRAKTFEDFKKDHERPADRDVPQLKEEADYIIDNAGGYEDMHQQVDKLMKQLQAR